LMLERQIDTRRHDGVIMPEPSDTLATVRTQAPLLEKETPASLSSAFS
jgi:hypothetical protein